MKTFLMNVLSCLFLAGLMFCNTQTAEAQILDYQNKVTLNLDDGTYLTLYGKAKSKSNAFTGEYYYLPTGLKLATKPDGTPQFLFAKYTTEETADAGGVQGAIMHFLIEWGLTPEQEAEAEAKLRTKLQGLASTNRAYAAASSNPKIMGPAEVYTEGEGSFVVRSASLSDGTSEVITSGFAPTIPGARVAVAAKMDKNTAQLLASTFEEGRSITDVSVELNYKYNLLFPAVDGEIIINWSKVQTEFERIRAEYRKNDRDTKTSKDDRYSYNEATSIYKSMIEKKAVIFNLDKNTTNDEVADQVVETFLNVFLEALTDRDTDIFPAEKKDDKASTVPNIQKGSKYVFNKTKFEKKVARQREVYRLKYRVAVPYELPLAANLGEWYDSVRDNEKCVYSVNLNDPFFQHREINMILDLEAEEMFEDEVNYVTVNVRKRRSAGNDFESHVTFDRKSVKDGGTVQSVTYARGEDKDPSEYEYKMQWSLRGGNIYPKDPDWIKGDWEGLTLAPPIQPRMIEFEADLDELSEIGVRRATLQMRYIKFGKEVETNIPITVSKGEPLVEKMIFTDRDQRGYAYRLVLTHEDKGKLALPWEAKINDDYVYASIPDELVDEDPSFMDKVIDAGKVITRPGSDGSVNPADTILDKFKDVLDVFEDK